MVANGIRWLDPPKTFALTTPHDFRMFESQKKGLEAEGKKINKDGYVVKVKK